MSNTTKSSETELTPEVMTFHEDGWVAEVEVLEDGSDAEWQRYKLRVLRTLQKSAFVKTPPDGDVFDVCALRNAGCYGGAWHLF